MYSQERMRFLVVKYLHRCCASTQKFCMLLLSTVHISAYHTPLICIEGLSVPSVQVFLLSRVLMRSQLLLPFFDLSLFHFIFYRILTATFRVISLATRSNVVLRHRALHIFQRLFCVSSVVRCVYRRCSTPLLEGQESMRSRSSLSQSLHAVAHVTFFLTNLCGRPCVLSFLTTFEEQHGNLSDVEVNEVMCFMSDVGAKISADHAVPCRIVFPIKLFFYVCSNVFLDVVFLQCLVCAVDRILLQIFRHVRVFYDCLAVRHREDVARL